MVYPIDILQNKRIKKSRENILSVIVLDTAGIKLAGYVNLQISMNTTLISMFLSAISNFSKELFSSDESINININQGDYLIHFSSNENLCVAVIGKQQPQHIRNDIEIVLAKTTELYLQNKNDIELEDKIGKILAEELQLDFRYYNC